MLTKIHALLVGICMAAMEKYISLKPKSRNLRLSSSDTTRNVPKMWINLQKEVTVCPCLLCNS